MDQLTLGKQLIPLKHICLYMINCLKVGENQEKVDTHIEKINKRQQPYRGNQQKVNNHVE